jgi:hypothetical protein
MKLLINLTNVHRDEQAILKKYLEDNCWQVEELTQDDLNALKTLLDKAVDRQPIDRVKTYFVNKLSEVKRKLTK